jgi:hypothetical protein
MMTQLRSGAAVTPQEAVRLRREAPRPNDSPEVLLRKIANSEIVWKNILSLRQKALRGSGYGQVPSFQAREPAVAPTGPRLRKPPS